MSEDRGIGIVFTNIGGKTKSSLAVRKADINQLAQAISFLELSKQILLNEYSKLIKMKKE